MLLNMPICGFSFTLKLKKFLWKENLIKWTVLKRVNLIKVLKHIKYVLTQNFLYSVVTIYEQFLIAIGIL